MSASAQHSSETSEWYSPPEVVERARAVLGGIDLDPASCEVGNRTVRAKRYIGAREDGLTAPWGACDLPVTVYLNPPTGRGMVVGFWSRLLDESRSGRLLDAVFVAFSLEQALTTQRAGRGILSFPFCIPRKRLAFVSVVSAAADRPQVSLFGGEPEPPEGSESPTHANAIVYVPGERDQSALFCEVFSDMGEVRR